MQYRETQNDIVTYRVVQIFGGGHFGGFDGFACNSQTFITQLNEVIKSSRDQ